MMLRACLCLSIRHPIVESGFQRYAASGDPLAIFCGDFYAAKGESNLDLVRELSACLLAFLALPPVTQAP